MTAFQTINRRSLLSVVGGLKIIVFIVMLLPAAILSAAVIFDPLALGANPAETILHKTGDWISYSLFLTLSVTPLRRLTGWNDLIKFRRMFGLFAFFYATLHLLSYLGFDRLFDFTDLARELSKRPFILVGSLAFLLMLPLAITSTRGWVRRLGGRTWTYLHRLVYLVAILGIVHYWWLVKRDIFWPLLWALVLALLLAYRLFMAFRPRVARARVVG